MKWLKGASANNMGGKEKIEWSKIAFTPLMRMSVNKVYMGVHLQVFFLETKTKVRNLMSMYYINIEQVATYYTNNTQGRTQKSHPHSGSNSMTIDTHHNNKSTINC